MEALMRSTLLSAAAVLAAALTLTHLAPASADGVRVAGTGRDGSGTGRDWLGERTASPSG